MSGDDRDVGYVPPYMTLKVEVMVDHSEAMLFSAVRKLTENFQFSPLTDNAKARCLQHVADMFKSGEPR